MKIWNFSSSSPINKLESLKSDPFDFALSMISLTVKGEIIRFAFFPSFLNSITLDDEMPRSIFFSTF